MSWQLCAWRERECTFWHIAIICKVEPITTHAYVSIHEIFPFSQHLHIELQIPSLWWCLWVHTHTLALRFLGFLTIDPELEGGDIIGGIVSELAKLHLSVDFPVLLAFLLALSLGAGLSEGDLGIWRTTKHLKVDASPTRSRQIINLE